MDLNLPTILSSSTRSRLRRADPRTLDTSKLKQSISLPSIELPHVGLPHVELPHAGLPHVELPHVELPHVELPQIAALDDAGRVVGNMLGMATSRLRDLRATVAPPPKRPSAVRRGVVALAIASIVGSIAAGVAFFLHPVRGAARRAALRRWLASRAGMARKGVETARDAARPATDRVVELVRIPVEPARDMVGSLNGHSGPDGDDAENAAALVAAGSMSGTAALGDSEGEIDGMSGAAESDHSPESHAEAEESAQAEAVGE